MLCTLPLPTTDDVSPIVALYGEYNCEGWETEERRDEQTGLRTVADDQKWLGL